MARDQAAHERRFFVDAQIKAAGAGMDAGLLGDDGGIARRLLRRAGSAKAIAPDRAREIELVGIGRSRIQQAFDRQITNGGGHGIAGNNGALQSKVVGENGDVAGAANMGVGMREDRRAVIALAVRAADVDAGYAG